MTRVNVGGPAAAAICIGSQIVAIDGQPTAGRDAIVAAMRRHKSGQTVRLALAPAAVPAAPRPAEVPAYLPRLCLTFPFPNNNTPHPAPTNIKHTNTPPLKTPWSTVF